MKIAVAASPLAGLRASQVCDAVARAWTSVRAEDAVRAVPVSDGVPAPYVGSGLEELLSMTEQVERGEGSPRRHAHVDGARVLFDYTDLLPGPVAPETRFVGEDIRWAVEGGADEIVVGLPVLGGIGDLGWSAIRAIARADDSSNIDEIVAGARANLGTASITVLVGGEQRLLGLSGIARAWMREGMEPVAAQEAESATARLADRLVRAAERCPSRNLMGDAPTTRGAYAGCGGGLAFALEILGARVFPIRHAVANLLGAWTETPDLVLYVCGSIGEDLPEGLHAASAYALERAIPVVVVYDSGALRRGELARLGLNGAYEIRPSIAFEAPPETPESAAELARQLDGVVRAVARTWGW